MAAQHLILRKLFPLKNDSEVLGFIIEGEMKLLLPQGMILTRSARN